MKIKMLRTQRGSPDGLSIRLYQEGKTYDFPDSLGEVFLKEGWGKEVRERAPVPEGKALGAAPEGKALRAAPENK